MTNTFSRRVLLQLLGSSALIATLPWTLRAAFGQSPHYEIFEEVEKALEHSVFYDEYKGNFAVAKQIADKIVHTARQSGNSTVLADALTALAKVQLLQGEATTALTTLSQVEPLVKDDPVRQYRFFTFSYVAKVLQHNTFPKGNGYLNVMERGKYLVDYLDKIKSLKNMINDPHALFEKELIERRFVDFPQILTTAVARTSFKLSDDDESFIEIIKDAAEFREKTAAGTYGTHLLPSIDLNIAEFYQFNRDVKAARENLARAKNRYKQSNDSAGFAACLLTEGDWLAAPFSTPLVLNTYIGSTSGSVDSNPAWVIEDKERLDITDSNLTQSKKLYQEAQHLFEKAGARRGLAAVALRYSYLAAMTENYSQAKQKSLEARKLFSEQGDQPGFVTATIHYLLARIGNGELIEENSNEISQITLWGTASGSSSYVLGLGIMTGRVARRWLLKDGDYERALLGYRLAETLYEASGNTIYQAKTAVDQGNLLLDLGEHTEAATLLDKAIQLYKTTAANGYGDQDWTFFKAFYQFLLLSSLFTLHLNRNDPDAMESVMKQIEELASQFPARDPQQTASAYQPLYEQINQFIREYIHFNFMVPALRMRKAHQRGDEAEMKQWREIALAVARKAPPGQREFNEGMVYAYARDFNHAKRALKHHYDQGPDTDIALDLLKNLPAFFSQQAVELQLQLMRRQFHQRAFATFSNLKAYEEAYIHLQKLESLAGKDWWQSEEKPWEELEYYGSIYQGLGRLEEATHYYDQAITLLESRRQHISRDQYKTALANSLSSRAIYFGAAETALQLADNETSGNNRGRKHMLLAQAYHYAERGKARGLLDLMTNRIGTASLDQKASSAVRIWHEANAKLTTWYGLLGQEQRQQSPSAERISYLNQRITEDEKRLGQAEQALAQSNPDFYQTINPQAKVLDAETIASHLPDGAMLIQYSYGSEDLLIWGITHDGQIHAHRESIDEYRFNRQIESFHRACEQRTSIDSLGDELSQLLLAPLADSIAAHTRLLIVPFGKMHLLPFQSLPFKGQSLVASHSISYLPSASTLQFMQIDRSLTATNRVLAIGNPANMSYQPRFARQSTPQPALAAAEKEAFYVAQLFPQGRALIGKQATKDAVRNAVDEYPILHFATHGILSDESPLLSSILLADGEALTVYELMGSHLNADLVVLSACRTAQGEVTRGDDVLGLTRGLLSAGARATVTTLWPVDDLATSLLMEQFYQHLRDGVPAASALQKAQNKLRNLSEEDIKRRKENVNRSTRGVGLSAAGVTSHEKNYSDPYFWAAFMLVG